MTQHGPHDAVPPLSQRASRTAWNLSHDLITVEVIRALRERGIETILIKGPTIAKWLYDSGERPYGDTDLLVAPTDFSAAEDVLRDLGFERKPVDAIPGVPIYGYQWSRSGRQRGDVDLHKMLMGIGVSSEQLWATLRSHRVTQQVLGEEITVLDEPARALHLGLHAAQHGERAGQPLDDLQRGLTHLPDDIWRQAMELTRSLGAIEAFSTGLRLLPEGTRRAAELRLPLTDDVATILQSHTPPPVAGGLLLLQQQGGLLNKILFVWRKVFPPREFIRLWYPPAGRGWRWLLIGYLRRPFWIMARLPRGVQAVRNARRVARSRSRPEAETAGDSLTNPD